MDGLWLPSTGAHPVFTLNPQPCKSCQLPGLSSRNIIPVMSTNILVYIYSYMCALLCMYWGTWHDKGGTTQMIHGTEATPTPSWQMNHLACGEILMSVRAYVCVCVKILAFRRNCLCVCDGHGNLDLTCQSTICSLKFPKIGVCLLIVARCG